MILVKELIQELQKLPNDALAYAYEGEVKGIIIVTPDIKELGYFLTSESGQDDAIFVESGSSA